METERFIVSKPAISTRVLCLGNELLADDALGGVVAGELEGSLPETAEVVFTSATGFDLLDDLLGASRLLVVDTIETGAHPAGTVSLLREEDVQPIPGESPHYIGLFETLKLGRKLQLDVPQEVIIIAVEAADCLTVGGPLTPAVKQAVPLVVTLVRRLVRQARLDPVSLEAACSST
jgi:hydrogenase maturation protease